MSATEQRRVPVIGHTELFDLLLPDGLRAVRVVVHRGMNELPDVSLALNLDDWKREAPLILKENQRRTKGHKEGSRKG